VFVEGVRLKWRIVWGIQTGFLSVANDGSFRQKMPDLMTDWDSVIRCYDTSDLQEGCKRSAVEALNYLREQFGENWVTSVREQEHPLLILFGNLAPWMTSFISDQVTALKALAGIDGFGALLEKLSKKGTQGFREALSVMDVAHRFNTFTAVQSLFQELNGGEKDVRLKLDGKDGLLEVTNSNSPLEKRETRTFEAIISPIDVAGLGPLGITVQGTISKPLSEKRAREGNRIIREAIGLVRKERFPRRVFMERAFDFTIYPKEKYPDTEYRIEGLPFVGREKRRATEIDRLYDVIRDKSEQLVHGMPGGVVVYSDPDYFVNSTNEIDPEALVNELEEAVYDRDRLSFFVLILIGIGAGNKRRDCGDFLYCERTKHELLCERVLVIRNRYANVQVSLDFLRSLIN
jgi:hypothetical protein